MREPEERWVQATAPAATEPLRAAISAAWLTEESLAVSALLAAVPDAAPATQARAADWVRRVRALRERRSPLDAFMQEYDLSSEEGVVLMCLAEALLRIPDDRTADRLIADKLADADWQGHLGRSDSLFVNASTWGLMLTGRIVKLSPETVGDMRGAVGRLVGKSTEPVIQLAVRQAMRLMGQQFVMGRDIGEALKRAAGQTGARHSFDMLGEAALTADDAQRYLAAYQAALAAVGAATTAADLHARPSISVKLSALHPRYEEAQRGRVLAELVPRLRELALAARRLNVGLTVDAEEADRLELSLDLFEAVFRMPELKGWDGFGLAVQAFGKRAPAAIAWLAALAGGRARIPVRLVKGAYWDTEIKRAQEQGLAGYPVFTRKLATDVSYLACARQLLAARDRFYPQFATHNAQTVSAVLAAAGDLESYEFQRLHGMGEALYEVVRQDARVPVRVYAPVGSHEDLLPYLVRRLLENGANTSFVNRVFDEAVEPEQLVRDPVAALRAAPPGDARLPLPRDLFGAARRNSTGLNFAARPVLAALANELAPAPAAVKLASLAAVPLRAGGEAQSLRDPADLRRVLGRWTPALPADVGEVVNAARAAQTAWDARPVDARAATLERAADELERDRAGFLRLLVREAGKSLPDADAEVRETVDYLRYYAAEARAQLAPRPLPGPTGEHNELQLHGRGVFACIAPWNFPLAIFTGQVAAALVAGNAVIAKPAEQTPLAALRMVELLHAAGVPRAALQCLLGAGEIGAALVADSQLAGVAFTGSVEVARRIARTLAARDGALAALVAETGGQNAMIADSSALPEQLVKDVLRSAFNAAGQRCSALRVLFVQEDIAERVFALLGGAMQELRVGDPALLETDVGPVIDTKALARLRAHEREILKQGRLIARAPLPPACAHGNFFAPLAVEIPALSVLTEEHFGPVLHVLRFRGKDLDRVIEQINATGYGLTLGVHTRIESTWRRVQARARVGNLYVNRNQIGAVVGVQPFGGEGLSGTGPKAGGPHYLLRFVAERTLTVNTAAVGGNAGLLAGQD